MVPKPSNKRRATFQLTPEELKRHMASLPMTERAALLTGAAKGLKKKEYAKLYNHPSTRGEMKGQITGSKILYDCVTDYLEETTKFYCFPRIKEEVGYPTDRDLAIMKDRIAVGHYVPKEPKKSKKTTTAASKKAAASKKIPEIAKHMSAWKKRQDAVKKAKDKLISCDKQGIMPAPEVQALASVDLEEEAQTYEQELKDLEELHGVNGDEPTTEEESGKEPERENIYGGITSAMKHEVIHAMGVFGILARSIANKDQWNKVLRWMVVNSKFIPDSIRIALSEGSSILNPGEDFNNPTIKFADEDWTQWRRFFWHALDCVCTEMASGWKESRQTALKVKEKLMSDEENFGWVIEADAAIEEAKTEEVEENGVVRPKHLSEIRAEDAWDLHCEMAKEESKARLEKAAAKEVEDKKKAAKEAEQKKAEKAEAARLKAVEQAEKKKAEEAEAAKEKAEKEAEKKRLEDEKAAKEKAEQEEEDRRRAEEEEEERRRIAAESY
ncbi:hypothetical protein BJ508DRAFT_313191 [Ascobolus immersus RN42]|uniref:Uncharacterized protein n=1 Tax=Ascobolus immersus RN42 TaxID=1160509 RepID=A0A3N4HJN5_ASCIM|nr:hypothetical protein BJ508DRAFT_313191 [Ascobolus immersus RN42]